MEGFKSCFFFHFPFPHTLLLSSMVRDNWNYVKTHNDGKVVWKPESVSTISGKMHRLVKCDTSGLHAVDFSA